VIEHSGAGSGTVTRNELGVPGSAGVAQGTTDVRFTANLAALLTPRLPSSEAGSPSPEIRSPKAASGLSSGAGMGQEWELLAPRVPADDQTVLRYRKHLRRFLHTVQPGLISCDHYQLDPLHHCHRPRSDGAFPRAHTDLEQAFPECP
jgi:hypothetical protein